MSSRTRTLRRFLGTFSNQFSFRKSLRDCGEAGMRLPNQLRPTRAATSSELRHLLPAGLERGSRYFSRSPVVLARNFIRIPIVAHIFHEDSRCGAHFS